MRGYARIFKSYRGSLQSVVQARSRSAPSGYSTSAPSGYSTYLETSEENRTLAQCNALARWRTILSSTEFRDALMLRYPRVPSNLPTSCDGCGESKKFNVNYALGCKKGGLVTSRHDEIRDELRDLLKQMFNGPQTTNLLKLLSRPNPVLPQ